MTAGDAATPRPGPTNSIADVPGVLVGHAQWREPGRLTGVTVVRPDEGRLVAAVDVRGGGPATRETDALDPRNLTSGVDAIVLTGGSAYGLDSAGGVMSWLAERHRGYRVGPEPHEVVPIVPTAALFDLGRGGEFGARPTADLGYAAARVASGDGGALRGVVGAGTGAMASGLKGGIGTASVSLGGGVVVAALVAVNAFGSTVDPATGLLYGAAFGLEGEFAPLPPVPTAEFALAAERAAARRRPRANTTIGIVATNARLDKARAARMAAAAHDGIARAIRPAHTLFDGDTVFAAATGDVEFADHLARDATVDTVDTDAEAAPPSEALPAAVREALWLTELFAAGADCVTRAIAHALLAADTVDSPPGRLECYRDVYARAASP
jgi:L-aminopeptidase/D-esterase-like protein